MSISKAVFGDAGIIVNARDDGYIEIAASVDPTKTVFLQLRTLAARAWIDSTSRMLKARARKSDQRTYRSEAHEYGTNTTMALTRSVNAGASEYALAFSEGPQSAFSFPIEAEEANVFVAIIRKAELQSAKMLEKTDTTAARLDSAARADSAPPPKKKKPAAKRPVSPPADTSKPKPSQPKPA